jgi:hypothetical protein
MKKLLKRMGILISSKLNPNALETNQRILMQTASKMITNPSTIISYNPKNGDYLLYNEKIQALLILNSFSVQIYNHVYGYDFSVSPRACKFIIDLINLEIIARHTKITNDFNKTIRENLKTMRDSLNFA